MARKAPTGYLAAFEQKYGDIERIAEDAHLHRVAFYVDAARKHLMNAEKELDYNRLKDPAVIQAMHKSISTAMSKRTKEYFGLTGDRPWYKEVALVNAYVGATAAHLKQAMDANKEECTLNWMVDHSEKEWKKPIFEVLAPSAFAHIPNTEAAKRTVLSEIGLGGKMDPATAKLEEIVQLMLYYHGNGGAIPLNAYKRSSAYMPPKP